jgi:hypothetical protein
MCSREVKAGNNIGEQDSYLLNARPGRSEAQPCEALSSRRGLDVQRTQYNAQTECDFEAYEFWERIMCASGRWRLPVGCLEHCHA